jgi:hypothetical protein
MPQSWQAGGAAQREAGARTFGQAIQGRAGRQGVGFPTNGNFTQPSLLHGLPDPSAAYRGAVMPIRPTTPWTNAAGGAAMLDAMGRGAPGANSGIFGTGTPQTPAVPQGPGVFGIPQAPAQPQGPGVFGIPDASSGSGQSWMQSSGTPEQPSQEPMGF